MVAFTPSRNRRLTGHSRVTRARVQCERFVYIGNHRPGDCRIRAQVLQTGDLVVAAARGPVRAIGVVGQRDEDQDFGFRVREGEPYRKLNDEVTLVV